MFDPVSSPPLLPRAGAKADLSAFFPRERFPTANNAAILTFRHAGGTQKPFTNLAFDWNHPNAEALFELRKQLRQLDAPEPARQDVRPVFRNNYPPVL